MNEEIDLSDAPADFGLPAMLRDMAADIQANTVKVDEEMKHVLFTPERARCYALLKEFALDSSARYPPAMDPVSDADTDALFATADFICASGAFIQRLTTAHYLAVSEAERRVRKVIDEDPAPVPTPWTHLIRVPFGAEAPDIARDAPVADKNIATLLDDFGDIGLKTAPIRFRAAVGSLHPVVEKALRVHPRVVLAGGSALAATVEGLSTLKRTDHDLFLWGVTAKVANQITRAGSCRPWPLGPRGPRGQGTRPSTRPWPTPGCCAGRPRAPTCAPPAGAA